MRFLYLTPLFIFLMAANESACKKKIPLWNKKVFVGSSLDQAVVRKQENEKISCVDSKFDEMICIRKKDFDCFFETYITNCKEWTKQSSCGISP